MSDSPEWLFVYGTLVPGGCYHPRIAAHVVAAHDAVTPGVLLDLGRYPAMIVGDAQVRGVLLSIAPAALAITDEIESYAPARPAAENLYVRVRQSATTLAGERHSAWTYFYAQPARISDRPACVLVETPLGDAHAWPTPP